MLKRFSVRGFKSLSDVTDLEIGALTLVFGPNAVGKSNLLDALQVFSRLATSDTAADALTPPVRGLPLETLTFPESGLPGLIENAGKPETPRPSFSLAGDFVDGHQRFRYEVAMSISPLSGATLVERELLQRLTRQLTPQQQRAVIETQGQKTSIRRKSKPAHPWEEDAPANHTQLSNRRYSGKEYGLIDAARAELASFRSYYLDPRVAMREAQPPQQVDDIGVLGEHLAPFLYRLKAEEPKIFESVRRTIRTVIPSIDDIGVDLDPRRGVLDIQVRQNGTPYSSRIVSEGTLRVLGLICVAVNPWAGSLVAFEEPENGVHPRRIEMIAQMMISLAHARHRQRQVILTTHSPILCSAILRESREKGREVRMYRAIQDGRFTRFENFESVGPLFGDKEIEKGLRSLDEERVFEELQLRGFFDAR